MSVEDGSLQPREWHSVPPGLPERRLSKDDMLDDITLYWLTNTATSSAQLYWENNNNNFNAVKQKTADISIKEGSRWFAVRFAANGCDAGQGKTGPAGESGGKGEQGNQRREFHGIGHVGGFQVEAAGFQCAEQRFEFAAFAIPGPGSV